MTQNEINNSSTAGNGNFYAADNNFSPANPKPGASFPAGEKHFDGNPAAGQPPHPYARLSDLFALIDRAEGQAQQAAEAALRESACAAPGNAVKSAKTALQAQAEAVEASVAAIQESMGEFKRHKELLQQKDAALADLRREMEQALHTAGAALAALQEDKAAAEQEAEKIGRYRQDIARAVQERQLTEQHMRQAQENLYYVCARAKATRDAYLHIQTLSQSAEKDLAQLLQSGPEPSLPDEAAPETEATAAQADAAMTEAPSLPPAPETGIAPAQKHDGSGAAFATAGYPRAGAKKKSGAKSTFWSYVIEILAVLALAILLRMFVMEITQVQGPSMQPTLSTGDRLITNKLAYTFGEPQRGDIVVLKAPDVENQYYIKRIIGLPDERLSINDGQVYINGEPLAEPYLTQLLTDGNIDVVIPEGYYFVMGDNREDSRDSRMDSIGLIAEDALSGKAEFRIFPGSKIGSIYH